MSDAESELSRMQMWVQNEQMSHWKNQIRIRQELVTRAKEAVRMKKVFKDSSGRQASAVDEEKLLQIALRKLAEAEQKLVLVKRWSIISQFKMKTLRCTKGVFSDSRPRCTGCSLRRGSSGSTHYETSRIISLPRQLPLCLSTTEEGLPRRSVGAAVETVPLRSAIYRADAEPALDDFGSTTARYCSALTAMEPSRPAKAPYGIGLRVRAAVESLRTLHGRVRMVSGLWVSVVIVHAMTDQPPLNGI